MTEGMAPVYDTVDWGDGPIDLPLVQVTRDERRRAQPAAITRGEWEDAQAELAKLADLLLKVTKLAAETQKRQCEMRAELIESGAFEKRSALILPDRMN